MNKLITNYKISIAYALIGIAAFASSCKKDRMPEVSPGPVSTKGIYVLCEGSFGQMNNSSITYYDIANNISDKNYFKTQNGIDLGTNANDLKQYGSKMYCIITGTNFAAKDSYVEVINIATGKSIKRIPFSDENGGFLPRFVVFNKSKAYISGYDGNITKIDTGSLNIEARVKVGEILEGLAIVNNKLYVTNAAHSLIPSINKTSVSVVDLNTFTKVKDIQVGFNPTKIAATNAGDLFVLTKGNYSDIEPSLDRISSVTDTKVGSTKLSLDFLGITGDRGFIIGDYQNPFVKLLNISSGQPGTDFITDGKTITTPYGVTINVIDDDVFVADANEYAAEGKFLCFSAQGKWKFEFATGTIPQSAVFNYSYK